MWSGRCAPPRRRRRVVEEGAATHGSWTRWSSRTRPRGLTSGSSWTGWARHRHGCVDGRDVPAFAPAGADGGGGLQAQGLGSVITTCERLLASPDQRLFLLSHGPACLGLLKVGSRRLFIRVRAAVATFRCRPRRGAPASPPRPAARARTLRAESQRLSRSACWTSMCTRRASGKGSAGSCLKPCSRYARLRARCLQHSAPLTRARHRAARGRGPGASGLRQAIPQAAQLSAQALWPRSLHAAGQQLRGVPRRPAPPGGRARAGAGAWGHPRRRNGVHLSAAAHTGAPPLRARRRERGAQRRRAGHPGPQPRPGGRVRASGSGGRRRRRPQVRRRLRGPVVPVSRRRRAGTGQGGAGGGGLVVRLPGAGRADCAGDTPIARAQQPAQCVQRDGSHPELAVRRGAAVAEAGRRPTPRARAPPRPCPYPRGPRHTEYGAWGIAPQPLRPGRGRPRVVAARAAAPRTRLPPVTVCLCVCACVSVCEEVGTCRAGLVA